jgi:drug/metabolite transporter (DMT)-like permease
VGLVLALACAVAFAGLDSVRKHLVASIDGLTLLFVLSAAQSVVYTGWVLSAGWRLEPSYGVVGPAVVVLQIVANLLLLRALAVSSLSRTIPFLSLTPVLTGVLGQLALGQAPADLQWAGIVAVTAGTLGLSLGRAEGGLRFDRGSLMALAVAGIWSATAALDKLCIERANSPTHAFVQSAAMAVLLLPLVATRGRLGGWQRARHHAPALALAVFFGSAALSLQLMAIETVLVSLVETIKRGAGSFLALVIGRFRFGEPLTPQKILSVGLVVVGTGLVLLRGSS